MSSTGLFDFTLRYQRLPLAKYHVRPLSLLQQDVLYRCDGTVSVADLADMTLYSHPEIRTVLTFLSRHGLVKTLPPEAWLFQPPRSPADLSGQPAYPRPCKASLGFIRRCGGNLRHVLRRWCDLFWFREPLDTPNHPQPWLPEDEQIVISVWNLRCIVSRWAWSEAEGRYRLAHASNANGLEAEAQEAVYAQGGATHSGGIYVCPPVLARKAQFGKEPQP